jgi:Arc/MetJ family transcription regulator
VGRTNIEIDDALVEKAMRLTGSGGRIFVNEISMEDEGTVGHRRFGVPG